MCGIVAVLNNYTNGFQIQDIEIFREMLYCDALRGEDATGIIGITNNGNVAFAKAAVLPEVFFQMKEVVDIFDDMWQSGSALIGHNRKATIGDKGDANNAHPFVERDVVLIHNGSIPSFGELMNYQKRQETGINVDSHVVAYLMAHEPDYQQVVRDVNTINGAYVFVWYNATEKKLRIVKNDQRPLGFIYNRKTGVLYIASELDMLRWIVGRNKGLPDDPKDVQIGLFKEHYVNEYTLGEQGIWDWKGIELPDMDTRPKPQKWSNVHGWGNHYEQQSKKDSEPKKVDHGTGISEVIHSDQLFPSSQSDIPEDKKKHWRMSYDRMDSAILECERIAFTIDDYEPHRSGKKDLWQFVGTMVDNEKVEVRGVFQGKEEDLLECESPGHLFEYDMVMAGFIRSIVSSSDREDVTVWVEKCCQSPFVLLKNKQVCPYELYEYLIEQEGGCKNEKHQLDNMQVTPAQLICYTCENEAAS